MHVQGHDAVVLEALVLGLVIERLILADLLSTAGSRICNRI